MKELLNEISYLAIDTRATKLHRGSLNHNPQTIPVVSVGGVLMDPNRHWSLAHSDELPARCSIGDIADSLGEWTAVAEQHDGKFSSYLAFSDYAGHAPIFYAFIPGHAVVISGSFSGAVQGLKNLGGSTTLNVGNYLTLVSGRARTFETLVASQTMANEIQILRPDEALFVEHDTVKFVDRDLLSPSTDIANYGQALTSAIEHTSNTISQVLSSNTDAAPILTLTGGVDSRLVLALLSTTEFLSNFSVWSIDPRNKKEVNQRRIFTADVEISNQIRKSCGLPWVSDWKRQKISASLAETLAHHQSYYSNYYFLFYTAKHVQVEQDPVLTLRGGGGEILRGSSNARISDSRYDEYVEAGGKLEDVMWAADSFLERSFLTNQLRPIAQDYLAEQLATEDVSSLRQKLDIFYRNHRNRAHFGHHRMSETKKDHVLQVLSSPHLQRLVELSDYEYVSSNGIVRDLFNATEPDLRKFPFEDATAHEALYLPSKPPFSYHERDGWMADFDIVQSRKRTYEFQLSAGPGHRGEDIAGDVQVEGTSFVRNGFQIIEQLVPFELRKALEVQHARVLSRLDNRQIPLGKFMAIVASATDIVAPMTLDTARHFFTDFGSHPRLSPRNEFHDAAAPYMMIMDPYKVIADR